MSYADLLAQYQTVYDKAVPKNAAALPDGKYEVIITDVVLGYSQNGDNFQITWKLAVCKGEYEGRFLPWRYSVISDDRMEYLKADLDAVGLGSVPLVNVEARLPELVGTIMAVSLATSKTNSKYQNVYFNRLVGKGDVSKYIKRTDAAAAALTAPAADTAPADPLSDDSDLPF